MYIRDNTSFEIQSPSEPKTLVVGAGFCGLAVAQALADIDGLIVVDAGSAFAGPAKWDKCAGTEPLIGEKYRARGFGGTAALWGGYVAWPEQDDIDYKKADGSNIWPIRYCELSPWRRKAEAALGLSETADAVGIAKARGIANAIKDCGLSPRLWRFVRTSVPERPSKSIPIFLNTVLQELIFSSDDKEIVSATVRCSEGQRHEFPIRRVILAAGGLENARILLSADQQNRKRFSSWLGRGFMEHIVQEVTGLVVPNKSWMGKIHKRINHNDCGENALALALPRALREKEKLPHVILHPFYDSANGAMSLGLMAEQHPRRSNRISLVNTMNDDGMPRLSISWSMSPVDRQYMSRSLMFFEHSLLCAGAINRVAGKWASLCDHAFSPPWCGHHMGTTRMGSSKSNSVTNSDGQVHGVSNLFVSGSSIFPTGGWANPTLLLLALALRQASLIRNEENLGRMPPVSLLHPVR